MRRPINSLTYAPTQMILICPFHNWELHLNRAYKKPDCVAVKRSMMLPPVISIVS